MRYVHILIWFTGLHLLQDLTFTNVYGVFQVANLFTKNNDSSPDAAAVRLRAHSIISRNVQLRLVADCNDTQVAMKVERNCDSNIQARCIAMQNGEVAWLHRSSSDGRATRLRSEGAQRDLDIYQQHLNRIRADLRSS